MSGNSEESRWRGPNRQSSQRNSGNGRNAGGQGGSRGGNASWASSSPSQDQHVPVCGFNATEAKNVLKRARCNTLSNMPIPQNRNHSSISRREKMRTTNEDHGARRVSNTMANGKDFFIELRKQVAARQRDGPPVGG
ncbi:hypothetical protein N7462_000323 [Penicillium macrosclerotiorum]|uniref:uncharacterized protein n=1 Tax=Penicillium macrosclerotiorum TaxID=303699 RepID=UPI002548B5E7|nr:uncharacterized protein N7462_000323 [Penicillium macrosclerotiorum]KAJ5698318.1 hypothetical protein N7462_000323 [Penicillium macrosclerotiorum]